jgi:hypothetical protein
MGTLGRIDSIARLVNAIDAGVRRSVLNLVGQNARFPVPLGFEYNDEVLLKPFCPPYYRDMEEAVLAFVDYKYAQGSGTFRDGGAATAWRDGARVQAGIPPYSDEAIAATIAYCQYLYQRYGRFPSGSGPFRTLLAHQAHHLDPDFYDRFYRPENTAVVIAGDFDAAKAQALIRTHYGSWRRGYRAAAIPAEPPQTAPRRREVTYPGRTLPIVSIQHRGPAWNAGDRRGAALEAFGTNSPLYRRLVLQERRAQSLGQSFDRARDPYIVTVQAMASRPEEAASVEADIVAEIGRYQRELVEPQRLADTKRNVKYGFLMNLESALDVAMALVEPVVYAGGVDALEEYFRTLDAVTPEDVREAARQYLVETGRTTIVMTQGS